MLAVLVTGSLAAAVVWRIAEHNAEDRQDALVDVAVGAVDGDANELVIAMSGTSALVGTDGSVSQEALDRFASDLSAAGLTRPVAWLVPNSGSNGTDSGATSGWEVRLAATAPVGGSADDPVETGAATGMDAGTAIPDGSAVANAADRARRTARPVITKVQSPDGTARLAVVKPVYRSLGNDPTNPQFVGVVMSADNPTQLSDRVGATVPTDVRFRISDHDSVLATSDPAPVGGVLAQAAVDGQMLVVHVQDARTVNHDISWFLLWIMAVIVAAAGVVGLRSARYDQERRRTNAMIGHTADLAQELATAVTADDVATVISEHLPSVFEADIASFGDIDDDDGVVRLHHGPGVDPAVESRLTELALADIPTLTESIAAGQTVLVRDAGDWRRALPTDVADQLLDAGARAAAVLPLEEPGGSVVATVGIIWWRPPEFDERTLSTLETVRELCEQSLARAALTDKVSVRASRLAELAEQLAGAHTVAQAAHAVTTLALGIVEANAASVGVSDTDLGMLTIHHGDTVPDQAQSTYVDVELSTPLAITDAATKGISVFCSDGAEYAERFPPTSRAFRSASLELGSGARAAVPLRTNDGVIGAIVFVWDEPLDFSNDIINELTTIAEITAQAVRRTQLTEAQVADARRSRALAELAQGLASRSETADIAGFLTESVLAPLGASYSVIGVLDGDRLIRRYSDGLVETGLKSLGEDYLISAVSNATPATDAARTGAPVFVASPQEAYVLYPEMSDVWNALGARSGAAVPVKDRSGRVVTVISVMWDRPATHRSEVLDALDTVAGMVGQTLERTGLVDELRRSVLRNQRLADFARLLADVRSVDELCSTVLGNAAAPVSAGAVDIALVGDDGNVAPLTPLGDVDGLDWSTPRLPLAAVGTRDVVAPLSAAAARSLRLGTMVTLDADAVATDMEAEQSAALLDAGIELIVYLPLIATDGAGLGVIALAWDGPQELTPTILAKLRTLSELCSQTLQRTRLREAEHRLVVSLQERVVHPVPEVSGLAIAERNLPAAEQVGMGGDWFEGIALDDHRYAVVIGDIAGHGINAVADMVELRAIIGALLRSDAPLEAVYPQVATLLHQGGRGLTATSCTAVFDAATDSVRYVSAGHLPPVLVGPDGTVELLEGGRLPLLGVPSSAVAPGTAAFPPGSMLALYTDGIVERRRESIDVSLDRLRHAMEATLNDNGLSPDVEVVADELLRRCLGDRPADDDVALVVVARRS
jgi:serine phosphatase RsbU (regulator of sigma subunit)/transcriptional regulator with GAF, ATPase, and Fis domain